MRPPLIDGPAALTDRLVDKQQIDEHAPEAEMAPELESFLAHLRLLVGVPFEYLVPDARLLPPESIRFFYLDRSWTDRLVDGALAVGKLGTRDQAHHQAHASGVQRTLDVAEHDVRPLQRGSDFVTLKGARVSRPADVVTGFLLRSAAVAGWPHMDVRAFDTVLHEPIDPTLAAQHRLPLLRLELLSPSVLLALFAGVPALVWCEEPHHGVQFGVNPSGRGFSVMRRTATGELEQLPAVPPSTIPTTPPPVPVPVRASNRRVVSIAGLRRALAATGDPAMPSQTGSAELAVELLDVPWRQRFEGAGGPDLRRTRPTPVQVSVVAKAAETVTRELFLSLVRP